MSEINEDFQYDSCISRGICSLSPKTSALQTVLVLYLRIFAKFALKLEEKKFIPDNIKTFILNTISITIYNPEFNENSYHSIINDFKKILPLTIDEYYKHNEDSDNEIDLEKEKAKKLFEDTKDIISAIKFGEKSFQKSLQNLKTKTRDLYNIMLVISKSLSINILDLESFNKSFNEGFVVILEILSFLNLEEENLDKIKTLIEKATKLDNEAMKVLRVAQEERYGEQGFAEVSYTTVPSKAVLVVGSNIRELETVLENLVEEDIDIYTHDEMMLAHTFPKFLKYEKLKGQFGQGVENCLLDFATFPGPIILTRHSLHNIENLYRGRLFTTDLITPKGVIRIKDNDFSELIESAKTSRGFKNGKQCETVTIGYDKNEVFEKIKSAIDTNSYEKIFLVGLDGYSLEQKAYFEKLIKLAPDNILIISFSYNYDKNNLIHINSCFDNYAIMRIFYFLQELDKEIVVFMPKCDRNTISQMVFLSSFEKTQVYVGKCIPILLNPTLMNTLLSEFKIKSISTAKKDLGNITQNQ